MSTGFIPDKDKASVKRVIRFAIRLLRRVRGRLPGYDSADDRDFTAAREHGVGYDAGGEATGSAKSQATEDEALTILGAELLKEHKESGEESIQFESLFGRGRLPRAGWQREY
jgi:hypothetical protein